MLLVISRFIGRFHVLLVHLPIGFLLIGLLLQSLASRKKFQVSGPVVELVYLCGLIAAIAACITGYLQSINDDYDAGLLGWHMWMGISVAFVAAILYMRLHFGRKDRLYKLLSVVLLVLVLVTGHLGGSLTHGEDYLAAGWSGPGQTDSIATRKIDNIQEAYAYADVIQPLLQARCYTCHGPRRQKGKLRLDDQAWILKGGKHGPVLGIDSIHGHLLKRILLPADDDDHMPPRRETQLTDDQVALIHWWLATGADFSGKVRDLPQPDSIKPLLLALQSDQVARRAATLVPTDPVDPVDEKSLQPLRDKGLVILPVSQGSHYLQASFVTAQGLSTADIRMLLRVRQQLAWINANNAHLTDSALEVFGQCPHLTNLQLNHTAVTDAGLYQLRNLRHLQSLSLVGTQVTARGVRQLDSIGSLATIYLYQTPIDRKDWPVLQKAFPKTSLDSGGYQVPLFPDDTVVVKAPAKKAP